MQGNTVSSSSERLQIIPPSDDVITDLRSRLDSLLGVTLWGVNLKSTVAQKDAVQFFEELITKLEDGSVGTPMTNHLFLTIKAPYEGKNVPPLYGFPTEWPFPGVYSGVVVIVGKTGSGKSEYLWRELQPDVVLRYGEPYEVWDDLPTAIPARSMLEMLELSIGLSILGLTVGIDALRYTAYNTRGPAGARGITTTMFTQITDMNNLIAATGASIPVVFNPMVPDDDIPLVFANAAGAVSGAVLAHDGVLQEGLVRTRSGRTGIGSLQEERVEKPNVRQSVNFDLNANVESTRRELREVGDTANGGPINQGTNFNMSAR